MRIDWQAVVNEVGNSRPQGLRVELWYGVEDAALDDRVRQIFEDDPVEVEPRYERRYSLEAEGSPGYLVEGEEELGLVAGGFLTEGDARDWAEGHGCVIVGRPRVA